MPHLWEVKHPYYCNDGNYFAHEQPVTEYGSWAEFFESEGDSDFDMNLLFRWDWRKADPEENEWGNEKETLLLFWMGQRKGIYRWTEVHVTEADEPAVRAWLETRWQHLKRLWTPLSETEPATV